MDLLETVMRYSLRTILLVILAVACITWIVTSIRNIDWPLASVVVSSNQGIELTDEVALALCESALKQLDFEVIGPVPAFGDANAPAFVGRNSISQDRVTTIWEIANQKYSDYTVRLERNEQGIVASIYANWLR